MPQVVNPPADDDAVARQRLYQSAGAPTTQFNGVAPKGALCVDYTNAVLYINTGTKAAATWTKVGTQT
ncbi:hypothetical protein ACMA1D_10710 [Streptomyces sp. 796.1]|uniref:hypothetical protein n=1 Tax=Streptomyces sp. 796.1 TaxID=3163029 RepID=UPI0039C8E9CD